MKIYLIRHGETDYNVGRILSGTTDAQLTDNGLEQARALARRFSDHSFDLAFSSDLSRAQKTLSIALGHDDFSTTPFLRERSFGIFEGRPLHEYIAHFQGSALERYEYAPPDGESYQDMVARLEQFWETHLAGFDGTAILAAHGSLNRVFLKWCMGTTFSDKDDLHQHNTCVNILSGTEPGTFKAEKINCTEHLGE